MDNLLKFLETDATIETPKSALETSQSPIGQTESLSQMEAKSVKVRKGNKDIDCRPIKSQNRALVNEALRLYLDGVPFSKIAKKTGVCRRTIAEWSFKNNWSYKRKQLEEKDSQKIINSIQEMKERHIKISKGIQGLFVERLKTKQIKINILDALKAMEHEARLLMPESFSIPGVQVQNNTQVNAEKFITLINEAKEERIKKEENK